jgi:hypothetical protein
MPNPAIPEEAVYHIVCRVIAVVFHGETVLKQTCAHEITQTRDETTRGSWGFSRSSM